MSAATMHMQGDPLFLPWQGDSDDARFRAALGVLLVVVFVMGALVPLLPVPDTSELVPQRRPEPLTQLLLTPREIVIPEVQPEPEPIPVPEVVAKPEPEPKPKPELAVPPPPPPEVVIPREQTVTEARETAALAGVLAFRDQLADLRDAVQTDNLRDTAAIQRGAGEAAAVERRLLTADQGQRSAGVAVAAVSNSVGGLAMAGRETTKVAAPEAEVAGGFARRVTLSEEAPARSIEDIRKVFDANKGAIYSLYNRALRSQPGLAGKIVLELVITAGGQVAGARVVSTDLPDEALVAKLLRRVQLFDFGSGTVAETTITYPLHFLPS